MTAGEVLVAWEGPLPASAHDRWGPYLRKSGNRYRVTVFVIVTHQWPEKHERTRRWLPAEDALQEMEELGLRRLLQKVVEGEVNALPA